MINDLIMKMVEYYSGDPHQIQHFIKVYSYSKLIGTQENVSPFLMEILESAAVVHDIGIKPALAKYGRGDGKFQEKEGPAVAGKMLEELHFDRSVIERVCYLIAHHHTYTGIDGIDYQILIEADFLVNLYEMNQNRESVETVCKNIFKTETGKALCRQMFLI